MISHAQPMFAAPKLASTVRDAAQAADQVERERLEKIREAALQRDTRGILQIVNTWLEEKRCG